jgi:hypothetical protein
MDIAYQFGKIGVFLANDGFVPILKQMAMALMLELLAHGIACKDSPHEIGDTLRPATQE